MKKWLIGSVIIAILAIAYVIAYNAPKHSAMTTQQVTISKRVPRIPTINELLRLTNEERSKAGVAPLTLDGRLNQSAQAKADDMNINRYFDHVNPITGKRGNSYIRDFTGNDCPSGSENLTDNIYENSSERAVQAWKMSKAHLEAMLDTKYDLTGFGIAGTKVVQHFCDLN